MCFVFYLYFSGLGCSNSKYVANAISFQFVPRVIGRERTLGMTGRQGATRAKNSSLVSCSVALLSCVADMSNTFRLIICVVVSSNENAL